MELRFYCLRVHVRFIEPEVWRRFVVPSVLTLDRLHDVLQIVLGWQDCHLHEFTVGRRRFTEAPKMPEEGEEEGSYRLADLVQRKGRKFLYTYDFGDDWVHELELEDSRFSGRDLPSELVCLGGERACPPEDVGGPPGYERFCEAIGDPHHPQHEELAEWAGRDFDPEAFDPRAVNLQLLWYLRWSRDRDTERGF